jgi:uncharacterized protein with PQ loop repeat
VAMSKVTGGLRRITSCHGLVAPMTSVVIVQRSRLPSVTRVPTRRADLHQSVATPILRPTRTEPRSTMIAALGFLAAALSIVVIWPQVWLSCRHGCTLGLSPTSSWLGVALNLCWLTFGLLVGDPAQIVTHVVVGLGNAAVLAALLIAQPHLRARRTLLRTAAGAAGLAALAASSIAAVALLGADPTVVAAALGSVISLIGAAAALPQLLGILFDRTRDLSGMSPARWYLGAGSCTSWVSYGWLIDQPTVWLSAGFGLVCALVTCVVLRARRAVRPIGARADLRLVATATTGQMAGVHVRRADAPGVLAAAA